MSTQSILIDKCDSFLSSKKVKMFMLKREVVRFL